MSTSWSDIARSFPDAAKRLQKQAVARHSAFIVANRKAAEKTVEQYIGHLQSAEANLKAARQALKALPAGEAQRPLQTYRDHQTVYNGLAAGLYGYSTGADNATPRAEGPPVVAAVVVLGVGFSIVGVAWALAHIADAAQLANETALFREELRARVDALKSGKTLPDATIDRQNPGGGGGLGIALGVGAVVLGGGVVWWLTSR